jgi:hypothetical protein
MSSRIRRAALSLGLTAGWYLSVAGILFGVDRFGTVSDGLQSILLFPLGILSRIAELVLGWYDPRNKPGHPWHVPTVVYIAIVAAHFLIWWMVFYALVSWWARVKNRRLSSEGSGA